MQTAEQSIASATARRRNQKKVPNFKTLTGEVRRGLKVGTFFFSLSRVAIERLQERTEPRANTALLETEFDVSIPNQIVINRFWGCTSVTFPSTNKTRSARENFLPGALCVSDGRLHALRPRCWGLWKGPLLAGRLRAAVAPRSFSMSATWHAIISKKKVPNFKTLTGEVRRGLKVGTFFFARCCGAFLNRFLVALSSRGVRTTARA